MPNSPILYGPNNTANNLQANLSQSGRFVGAGIAMPWTTGIAYSAGDTVSIQNSTFICLTGHTASATFATDYTSGYWQLAAQTPVNRNYLSYGGSFEDNTVQGWTACKSGTMSNAFPTAVGTGNNPFSSSNGGTAATTLSAPATTSSSPIIGTYSLNMATSASGTTAGDMYISSKFAIPAEDVSKSLTFKFAYKLAQDTNSLTNFSGTSSNTFGVAIYDLANNAWIQPAGVFNFVQKSGVGICTGTFQSPSNATSFQLAVYCATASGASTISLYLDDFYCGPQTYSVGPAMSDWQSYTPTITSSSGTITNYTATGNYRRVGDSLEGYFQIRWTGAAGTWDTPYVSIPSGLTIDTAKFPGTNDFGSMTIGQAGSLRSAVSNQQLFVRYQSTTQVALLTTGAAGTYIGSDKGITNTVPVSWGSGDVIWGWFKVPITGWSSNSLMSSDTAQNVVALAVIGTNNTSFNATPAAVQFGSTVNKDTNGAYNSSTGVYTVPVAGFYIVEAQVDINSSLAQFNGALLVVYKNGSPMNGGSSYSRQSMSTSAQTLASPPQVLICNYFNAGDTISIYLCTITAATTMTAGNNSYTFLNIYRLSGPAVITATDTVTASYNNNGGKSIPHNTLTTVNTGWNKTTDSHNAFSNGVYTIPVSGRYLATVSLTYASAAVVASQYGCSLAQAGSTSFVVGGDIFPIVTGTSNNFVQMWATYIFYCVAGDTITVQAFQQSGSNLALYNNGTFNIFSIIRVGN